MISKVKALLHHSAGWVLTAVFLLPLFWVLVASLREPGLPPPNTVEWWPTDPQWHNYQAIFERVPMTRYMTNSVLVVATAVPLTLIIASMAGFGMSQLPRQPRRQLVYLSIALLIVPAAAVWLFRFQILRWLGLLDTLWALILPAFTGSNALFVLLFYWTFRRIPGEMFEAAQLDGATAVTVWWRLALPLSRPTIVGVAVLTFVMYWSDFISPILYIFDPQNYTLAVGLQILNQLDRTNWSLLMAGAVVMTLPVILLFILLQRFFLHDLSLSNLFDKN
jgi:multiple sugar transport system permease protein